jgi:hypothetical protein
MLRKKFKKYLNGGSTYNPSTVGAMGSAANLLGESIRGTDPTNTNGAANFLSGAGQGAQLGAALGPIGAAGGAIIGAGYSMYRGYKEAEEAQKIKDARQEKLIDASNKYHTGMSDMNRNLLQDKSNQLVEGAQYAYKNGGKLKSPLANKMMQGGGALPLSSDTVEMQGNTHEEGGIKIPELNAELEDNETVKDGYVFSDNLGFADKHKSLAKDKGSLEKKLEIQPYNSSIKNSIKRIESKEQDLMKKQESLRASLGYNASKNEKKFKKDTSTTTGLDLPEFDSEKKTKKVKGKKESKDKKGELISPRTFGYENGGELLTTNPYQINPVTVDPNQSLSFDNVGEVLSPKYKKKPEDAYSAFKSYENLTNEKAPINPYQIDPIMADPLQSNNKRFGKALDGERPITNSIVEEGDIERKRNLNFPDINTNRLSDASSIVNMYDNMVNRRLIKEREGEDIPLREKLNYTPLELKRANLDASKTEADQQRKAFAKGVSQSAMSTNTKNALRASGLSSSIREKNKINQQEQLTNLGIENKERSANTQNLRSLLAKNKEIDYANVMTEFGARDDIRRDKSDLAANLTTDLGTLTRDVKLENLGRDTNALRMATSDPRSRSYIARNASDILKKNGHTDEQIKRWAKEYNDKDYLEYKKESKKN